MDDQRCSLADSEGAAEAPRGLAPQPPGGALPHAKANGVQHQVGGTSSPTNHPICFKLKSF